MGFLSAYSGTRKVTVGDPERGYWVELREHVSQGAKEEAERALASSAFSDGGLKVTPDVARYRQLMLLASVKDWNLDDDHGQVWPIDIKHVQMLPGDIFDYIWKIVDKMNEPMSPADRQQFRDERVGSDSDGDSGTELTGYVHI